VTRIKAKVDGYIRVSRIGGRAGDGYISPQVQREQIEAFASLIGVTIDQWHDDQDLSGGNADRPGFLEVVRRIEARETGGVIVAKIDRFARSAPDGGAMVRRILRADGLFASAQERIDPSTDFGKAMLNIMFVMAELQLDQLKSGWKTAKGRAINRGAHIGPTPFGYTRVPRGTSNSGKLEPHAAHARVVTELFERASRGAGVSELARWLDEAAPRDDDGLWTTSSVGHLLRNRVYLGEVAYRCRTGEGRDLVNRDAHTALTDLVTWEAAQPGTRPAKRRGTPYLLSGLVRCASCRYVMTGIPGGSRGHIRVYRCTGRHGAGRCPAPSMIVADPLESWVTGQVQELLAGRVVHADPADRTLEELADRVARAEDELDAFMLDLDARARYGDRFDRYLDARLRAVEDAEAAYERAAADTDVTGLAPLTWESLTVDERHRVIAGAVDAVFVRRPPRHGAAVDERAAVVWRGHGDPDLPGKGRKVIPLRPYDWPHETTDGTPGGVPSSATAAG
jgi:DNA invertase Pin-like site-specific DNA recombinase